jgi:hypothetical protein
MDTQTIGYALLAVFVGTTMTLLVASGGAGPVVCLLQSRALGLVGRYTCGIYVYHFSLSICSQNSALRV